MRTFLIRGMLAGFCAAFVAFGFARIAGEPAVDRSIAFEEEMADLESAQLPPEEGAEAEHDHEVVSRSVQSTFGLLAGLVATGVALGGIFSIAFAFAYGRVGRLSARATALTVAGLSYVAIYLVPALKYPPNPPATGNPDTINSRTQMYFLMISASVIAMVLAVNLAKRLAPRFGEWNASIISAVSYLAVMVFASAVLPVFDEIPDGFPAATLWQFRISSFGIQAVLWIGIGLVFGGLTVRSAQAVRTNSEPTPVAA